MTRLNVKYNYRNIPLKKVLNVDANPKTVMNFNKSQLMDLAKYKFESTYTKFDNIIEITLVLCEEY